MIFTCATDNFQKSRKMLFLKIALKICRLKKKNQMFDVFKVARPVCSSLHFDLGKHFIQKPFTFKTLLLLFVFLHFLPKNEEVKEFFSKTPPNGCPYKCRNLGKKSVQYHQRIVRKMRLKTFEYTFV